MPLHVETMDHNVHASKYREVPAPKRISRSPAQFPVHVTSIFVESKPGCPDHHVM